MSTRILYLTVALLFSAVEAWAQPVTTIGPVTPGNIPQYNSPTVIKDSGVAASTIGGSIANSTVVGNFSGGPAGAAPQTVPSCANDGAHALTNNNQGGFNCAAVSAPPAPGGRLTIASGVCAPSTDQVSQTTIYYAPCGSQWVPIYNGTVMQLYQFTSGIFDGVGLSLAMAGSANWATFTIYDVYVGLNSNVVTLCTGPAWTNSGAGTSARGSGPGTTQLQILNGIWTNAFSMTCRFGAASTFTCPASQCTYVGSFMTTGSTGTIDLRFGTVGTNCGTGPFLSIWNQYNRKETRAQVADSTVSWTYTTAAFRAAHNSNQCSVSIVVGMPDDAMYATYQSMCQFAANSAICYGSIGLNSNSAPATKAVTNAYKADAGGSGAQVAMHADWFDVPPLGLNQIYALEQSDGTNANIFFGANAPTNIQGLSFKGLM